MAVFFAAIRITPFLQFQCDGREKIEADFHAFGVDQNLGDVGVDHLLGVAEVAGFELLPNLAKSFPHLVLGYRQYLAATLHPVQFGRQLDLFFFQSVELVQQHLGLGFHQHVHQGVDVALQFSQLLLVALHLGLVLTVAALEEAVVLFGDAGDVLLVEHILRQLLQHHALDEGLADLLVAAGVLVSVVDVAAVSNPVLAFRAAMTAGAHIGPAADAAEHCAFQQIGFLCPAVFAVLLAVGHLLADDLKIVLVNEGRHRILDPDDVIRIFVFVAVAFAVHIAAGGFIVDVNADVFLVGEDAVE